jgi:C1A family cysteine protease
MYKIVSSVLIIVFASLLTGVNSLFVDEFKEFIIKFEKKYNHDEFNQRLRIFKDNFNFINEHNKAAQMGNYTYFLDIGPFADMTNQEYYDEYLNPYIQEQTPKCQEVSHDNQNVPVEIDWREMNAVTPIKNQGNCGSCWSFSTTGAIEGLVSIQTGQLTSLSEQQLVDCSGSFGNQGCYGGLMPDAFEYVIENEGLCSETDYPYEASEDNCSKCNIVEGSDITGCSTIKSGDSDKLFTALSKQPISVAIQANSPKFQHYKSGIYDDPNCYKGQLDHGVLLVAYDSDSLTIKNSWGSMWGDNGYIKIARTDDSNGTCGVYLSASFPTKMDDKESTISDI